MSENIGGEILASAMAQQMSIDATAGAGTSLDDVVKDHSITIISRFIEDENQLRKTDVVYAIDLMMSVMPDDQLKPTIEHLKDRLTQWDPAVDSPHKVVDEVFAQSHKKSPAANDDISVSLSFDAQNSI